uniref:Uncharacterized protein n=1 Tax=Arundo donax TaxID=35708 RepID=A0A0A9HH43_ARUDO
MIIACACWEPTVMLDPTSEKTLACSAKKGK